MRDSTHFILFFSVTLVIGVAVGLGAAQLGAEAAFPQPEHLDQGIDDRSCLACHASPDLQTQLPSGEILDLTVSPDAYDNSVHGIRGYACVQCHTDIRGYPHPPLQVSTLRQFTLSQYQTCTQCHQDKYQATLDSVHQEALAAGKFEAAVCTDCHGAHDIKPPGEPRTTIPQTCRQCHTQIFELYEESVHGEALIGEGNPDVPTCTDCHGVHTIQGPTDGEFRLFSPQICAQCHADDALMARYGITTDVFETYVADFHGTTVTLYQAVAPGQETNKPVCIDCHGVHDIAEVDDPDSPVIKANLVDTCRKCHPDASANFPSAWLSHYRPSPEHWPLVYYVNLFYKIFIPTVIGGMLIFVVANAGHRFFRREKEAPDE